MYRIDRDDCSTTWSVSAKMINDAARAAEKMFEKLAINIIKKEEEKMIETKEELKGWCTKNDPTLGELIEVMDGMLLSSLCHNELDGFWVKDKAEALLKEIEDEKQPLIEMGKEYMQRNGMAAEVLAIDMKNVYRPVVARTSIDNGEDITFYNERGFLYSTEESEYDLVPKKLLIKVGSRYLQRNGEVVRIICTDRINYYSVIGLCLSNKNEHVQSFTEKGFFDGRKEHEKDLIKEIV